MFESFEDALGMIGLYAAIGFVLAVLYNIIRFFAVAFPSFGKITAVFDILFCLIAGLVLFAFSVEYGTGFFRLYYVIAAAFGFAVNTVTLGAAVPPLARLFGRICRKLGELLEIPLHFICEKSTQFRLFIQKNLSIFAEKVKLHLKKRRQTVYNSIDHKIGKVYAKGGENRNAVKAKVRKTF